MSGLQAAASRGGQATAREVDGIGRDEVRRPGGDGATRVGAARSQPASQPQKQRRLKAGESARSREQRHRAAGGGNARSAGALATAPRGGG